MQLTVCIHLELSIVSNNDEKKLVLVYMSSFPGFYGHEGEIAAIARSNATVHNHVSNVERGHPSINP
jgi:hypothetical protein